MARPGIMLYFDILEPIRVLPDADKGRLLVAMLEYGQSGIVPEFDGNLGLTLAWGFVKPKIDKDDEAYKDSVIQREYAAFCKKRRRLNLSKIPFEEWLNLPAYERERLSTSDNDLQRPVDFVDSRYPTTTTATHTSTTPSTNTSTSTTTAAAATTDTTDDAAAADSNLKVVGGELGKNVVFLSDSQMGDLLEKLGIEAFDHYVEKLANFIIKNNAHVKNHYETILKWWKEDGTVSQQSTHTNNVPKGASGRLGLAELEAIQRVLADE